MFKWFVKASNAAEPHVAIDNFQPKEWDSQSTYPMQNRTRLGRIRSNEYVVSAIKLLNVDIAKPSLDKEWKRWVTPNELAIIPETKRRPPVSKFSFLFFLK
jgi:hypothetical protein